MHSPSLFSKIRVPKISLFAVLICIGTTLAMKAYYNSSENLAIQTVANEQHSKAQLITSQINTFSTTTMQLSQILQKNLNASTFTKPQLEKMLKSFLSSGPEKLIYGMGIWYQPYRFAKDKKFFGPYAYRDSEKNSSIQLTYEWNTEEYDYIHQKWYQEGLRPDEDATFVQPYLDNDLVYVTLSRSFFDAQNKIEGLITVDMILPQLHNLIQDVLKNENSIIYITTQDGHLIEHSLKMEFLKALGLEIDTNTINTVINHTLTELQDKLKIDLENLIVYETKVPKLNWIVGIQSNKGQVVKKLAKLKETIILASLTMWLFMFFIVFILHKNEMQKMKDDEILQENRAQMINSSKLATLGEISSGIAHEINNPLTIIISKVEILKRKMLRHPYPQDEILSDLDKIQLMGDRISKIVRGLKTLSRDSRNDQFQEVSLKELINEVISFCSERLKIKGIELRVQEIEDIKIECRSVEISQILLNLLNNSTDAVDKLPEKWIQINTKKIDNQNIEITITDSGLGISAKIVDKLMQPFFTTKEVGKGTGLGLSISHGIARDHKGSLLYNKKSAHTQFVLTLPLMQKI
jgi:signal transduction histidine kinase